MNKNTKKTVKFQSENGKSSFDGIRLTKFAGLSPIMRYIKKQKIHNSFDSIFPTLQHNATKFSNTQIFLSTILVSLSGVNRIVKIANFTKDCLVMSLLNLKNNINKDVISTNLKILGQNGAFKLQEYLLQFNNRPILIISFSKCKSITI